MTSGNIKASKAGLYTCYSVTLQLLSQAKFKLFASCKTSSSECTVCCHYVNLMLGEKIQWTYVFKILQTLFIFHTWT